jgi:4-hydroxy-3-methylbut-2-enyl diphosphate reductase
LRIRKARALGFCFGVRRAIKTVEAEVGRNGAIDSLGSVVHNPQVVARLAAQGVGVVNGFEEVRGRKVAVTAHGVGPHVYEEARARDLSLIDTTCPIVAKAQRAARRLVNSGFPVVVYGDDSHPEVRGVLAWTNGKGVAVLDPSRAVELPRRKVAILSQTTKSEESFARFVGEFLRHNMSRLNEVRVINTTCPETEERYEAARQLAHEVDLMIVVGGRNSANTRKLAETCAASGVETYHVESASEIRGHWLEGKECVGVTAGASTPDEGVEEVIAYLRQLDRQRNGRATGAQAHR